MAYPPGATPLDPNEVDGLIPDYISSQGELNVLERENILDAINWTQARQHADILNVTFVLELHRRMFGRVWRWAGRPRKTNKTIGVSKEQISTELASLLGDANYWINKSSYPPDEIGARFHHRLVSVHVFVNGNSRHARLMTDILLTSVGQAIFTWGMTTSNEVIEVEGALRQAYITALKKADGGDWDALLEFVRS